MMLNASFCSMPLLGVYVDGVLIQQPFYIDTDAGIVKTFDVMGDGHVWWSSDVLHLNRGDWETPPAGVASKTIRGKVTFRARPHGECYPFTWFNGYRNSLAIRDAELKVEALRSMRALLEQLRRELGVSE